MISIGLKNCYDDQQICLENTSWQQVKYQPHYDIEYWTIYNHIKMLITKFPEKIVM